MRSMRYVVRSWHGECHTVSTTRFWVKSDPENEDGQASCRTQMRTSIREHVALRQADLSPTWALFFPPKVSIAVGELWRGNLGELVIPN